ncbi:MAG: class I SAM-dependent DNA methyltransferase [Gemmataceae bacterium]|nr:class I SAM-dependent DNA methyltransferase [Gemmataceae bacterium]
MTPQQFIAKWKAAELKERAACQEHFLDVCKLLGQPTPAEADPTGEWYTFEKGVDKDTGGQGFADVWRRGFFGWEYKGKRKNLADAYRQLSQYREALANPPLLIVCDLNRFEIHTNFTGTVKEVHAFDLDGLAEPENLAKLRNAFTNPDALKPGRTQAQVTEEVAEKFVELADGLRKRNIEPHAAGHFLMKLMFCMFAEDIGLLPEKLFERTVKGAKWEPEKLSKLLRGLFEAMAKKDSLFGADEIPWINGGLFKDADVIDLEKREIQTLAAVTEFDWSNIEPSIFGTLFERILNPDKRSQLGAHYTSREDIETLVEPVIMAPLRREWAEVKAKADKLWEKIKDKTKGTGAANPLGRRKEAIRESKELKALRKCLNDFLYRLAHVTVLDPACGSGNFLYVALQSLLNLEKEVIAYSNAHGVPVLIPGVRPTQLHGIELNPYAQELAQVVIWIGYLQWMKFNGFVAPSDPVLDAMTNIENRDAILDLSDPEHPKEPEWPVAEFIVGNPPFLGTKKLRSELGDIYVESMFKMYASRIPNFSDLCCYWFEKSRSMIEDGKLKRAGLIATQGIRGGENRVVLKRIKESGDIFFAVGDQDWYLDGAAVHISMVGFDNGEEEHRLLDGEKVKVINPNLSANTNVTDSKKLKYNRSIGFVGDVKSGAFDIGYAETVELLKQPNAHGKPSSDVLFPWINGLDVTRRPRDMWIIDFGSEMPESEAALYEQPFNYVLHNVKPLRDKVKRAAYRDYWWIHAEPCEVMRQQIFPLTRFLTTTVVSKHRIFAWIIPPTIPDHQLIAFARSDDYFFGVLHSRIHEVWARSQGTQVRERESGFRYTPTTCFETFPFPEPTDAQRAAIAAAAKELDTLRNNWLNPPEWTKTETLEFPGSADGPWKRYVVRPNAQGIGTVKYPRIVPKDAATAAMLKKRTLTNLYNERPTWLANVHRKLDEAVFAAYGWSPGMTDDELLAKLLELNLSRAASE